MPASPNYPSKTESSAKNDPRLCDVTIPDGDGRATRDQAFAVTPNPAVARAIALLWVALILYVVGVVLDAANLTRKNDSAYILFLVILNVAVWSFPIGKISEGKTWARIVYLVFFSTWAVRDIFEALFDFHRFPALETTRLGGAWTSGCRSLMDIRRPWKKWFEPQRS
ncbi:MAG TPA: hypothetical protein VJW20_11065 [Candidatus Angelobacter sp.]|nr:hypothetical protein [Candidatus Angelobacter sp.]